MQKRADQRKFHIIYKTTCISTGKWYIGMHSTDDLNDGYIGSGQRLWKSVNKYGKEQHICEVLEQLPDRKSLSQREEQILTEKLRQDPLCMNVRGGGTGNYPGKPQASETRAKKSASMKQAWATGKMTGNRGRAQPPEEKLKQAISQTGQKKSASQKLNISQGLAAHYSNAANIERHKARVRSPEANEKRKASLRAFYAAETEEQRKLRIERVKLSKLNA